MTLKRYIAMVLLSGLLFACQKQEEETTTQKAPIRFETNIVPASNTKGTSLDKTSASSIGVYAYYTELTKWENAPVDPTKPLQPNWMDNEIIQRVSKDVWNSREQTYWPIYRVNEDDQYEDAYLSFFAYAPYVTPGIGITVPQSPPGTLSTTGIPEISLEVSTAVDNQADLLLAAPLYNRTEKDNNGVVAFHFAHVLTKIGFQAYCLTPATTIQSITVTNLQYKATIKIDGAKEWKNTSSETTDFTLELNGTPISTNPATPTNLSAPNNYLFMLPQDLTTSSTSQIKVVYHTQNVSNTKTAYITENWEMNKSILYTLNLGGSATQDLEITQVTITDWTLDGSEELETN